MSWNGARTLPDGRFELPVATLVVRDGHELEPAGLARHVEQRLDGHARPRVVTSQAALPISRGHRVLKQQLRARLLDGAPKTCWRFDDELKLYEPLDAAGLAALFAREPQRKQPGAKPKSKRPRRGA